MKLILITTTVFFTILFSAVDIKSATLTVTNTNDAGTGSLREAVYQSHLNTEADTIVFDAQIFNSPKTIILTTGQLPIGATLTIEGPGANLLTISGNHESRIFSETSGFGNDLIIKNLTLTGGYAVIGGAVYSQNSLKLYNVVITGNTAIGNGANPDSNPPGLGGGVYSSGSLTIVDSIIRNNLASGGSFSSSGGGGGIYSRDSFGASIINCTFINNTAKGIDSPAAGTGQTAGSGGYAYGGAIYSFFGISIVNSRFMNNSAIAGDGGSVVDGGISGAGGGAFGGAIYTNRGRILNSTVNNNSAMGGDAGSSPLTHRIDGGGKSSGGGIFDRELMMANTTVVNNTVTAGNGRIGGDASGGGVYLFGNNQWKVYNSTVTGNSVAGGAGFQMNGSSQGGGVFSEPGTGQSSFYNNIVAENSADTGRNVFGSFYNPANNLIRIGGDATGFTNGERGNLVGTADSPINPMLAPLADNGGLTETRALLAGSPAIDAGNNLYAVNPLPYTSQPLQFDQRNFQRIFPNGGVVDIGAYEAGASKVTISAAPDLQNSSDTGVSNNDNITKATMPRFDISDTIPGAKVELLRNNEVVSSVIATSLSVSLTDSNPPLDGVVQYASRQTINNVMSDVSPVLTVTFDNTSPKVTVSQHIEQADPTIALPIRFTVAFNEPINGLNRQNISLQNSTADVSNAVINVNFVNYSTYTVEVSNIGTPGEIVLTLAAGAASDFALNYSDAPVYQDNSVSFQPEKASVSVSGWVRKFSGKIRTSTTVTLTDTFTGEVWTARTNPFGYYHFNNLIIYKQIGRRFTVKLTNKSFVYNVPQTVIISSNRNNLNFSVQ